MIHKKFYSINRVLLLLSIFALFQINLNAQAVDGVVDCGLITQAICSSSPISYTPEGIGTDDFASSSNSNGCLTSNERQAAWYYFEFDQTMPPNSVIEFTINPNNNDDYDFAIYGPDVDCNNLGSPIRCSYSGIHAPTGLGNGATDTSEGAGGDAWVAPLTVQPGEGYFLLVDNFSQSAQGFTLTWSNSGAPFLDCDATPVCEMVVDVVGPTQVCPGSSFFLTSIVTNETGFVSYFWEDPSGVASINPPFSNVTQVTIPDDYTGPLTLFLTVMDDNCDETVMYTVNTFSNPPTGGTFNICPGELVDLSPGAYSSYNWSNGFITPTITVNQGGTYTVTVTDASGCQGVADFIVNEHPPILPIISGENQICEGGSNILSASSGSGANIASYAWSNGGSNPFITISMPGTYSVTMTDVNGCIDETDFTVNLQTFPPLYIAAPPSICMGDEAELIGEAGYSVYSWENNGAPISYDQTLNVFHEGTYDLVAIDNFGCIHRGSHELTFYPQTGVTFQEPTEKCPGESILIATNEYFTDYSWSTGETTPTITVQDPGVYDITATDFYGCENLGFVNITENPVDAIITGDEVLCAGEEGLLNSPFDINHSYFWSNGYTTSTIPIVGGGSYSLTVTNQFNCTDTASIVVEEYDNPDLEILGNTSFCTGFSTILEADTTYANYEWSNNTGGQSIEVFNSGTFTLTVTDANGCMDTTMVSVTEQAELTFDFVGETNICTGTSGTLGVSGDYDTYSWSTGENTPSITISTPETISVTVTDLNGCSGENTIDVTNIPLPNVSIAGTSEYCAGDSTEISVAAGFSSVSWSTGETSESIFASSPGNYSVTVVDGNGCVNSTDIDITENALPTPQIDGALSICPGDMTTINLLENYNSYNWSTGSSNSNINLGAAGDYSVAVTDANGCVDSVSFSIEEYVVTVPNILGDREKCEESGVMLSSDAPYASYTWSTTATDSAITVADPGTYSLSVTDFNGCDSEASATVSNYITNEINISGLSDMCTGELIVLNAPSTGFNSYNWSTGATIDSITIATGGTYSVTATDSNDCISEDQFELTEHSLPEPAIEGSLSFCINGTTELSANDTYSSYLWSSGETTPQVTVSLPGNITLSVSDEWGCENMASATTVEAEELDISITGTPEYCALTQTTLSIPGNFATIDWSNGASTSDIDISSPGMYTVSVVDDQACRGFDTIEVIELPLPQPEILGTPEFCFGESTMLSVQDTFSQYLWQDGAQTNMIEASQQGNFDITVTDDNGCINNTSIFVAERPLPIFQIDGTPFFCEDASTSLQVNQTFNTYQWDSGEQSQSITTNTAGEHTVVVSNEYGCEDSRTISIDEVSNPTLPVLADQSLDCEVRRVFIGNDNYPTNNDLQFNWSGLGINVHNEHDVNPFVDSVGTYQVYIEDTAHNCISETGQLVVDDLSYEPQVILKVTDVLDCVTQIVLVDGSDSDSGDNFIYRWYDEAGLIQEGNSSLNSYDASTSQWYILEVIDTITHCISNDSIFVEEDLSYPLAEAGIPGHLDCRVLQDTLDATQSQMGPNIIYQWTTTDGYIQTGANTLSPIVSAPGLYQIMTLDTVNNCSNVDSVLVSQDIVAPLAQARSSNDLDCHNQESLLSAEGSSTGDQYEYNWYWNNGGIPFSQTVTTQITEPGTYTIEVTNLINGCTETSIVEVELDDDYPQSFEAIVDDVTCYGDEDGSIVINSVDGGVEPLMYSVNGSPYVPNTIYNNLGAGEYLISIEDANGCVYEDFVQLIEGNDLQLDLGDDQYIILGQDANLQPSINIPSTALNTILWNSLDSLNCVDEDCLEINVRPFETTNYGMTIIDENGCLRSDDVTVYVDKEREIFVPNVFSPNGDGNNDVLYIFADGRVENINEFIIFNRWGESVFEVYGEFPANDPAYGWDGLYRDQVMNAAVFTWYAKVKFIDGHVELFKGDVVLMR